jgi:hypothetical protein
MVYSVASGEAASAAASCDASRSTSVDIRASYWCTELQRQLGRSLRARPEPRRQPSHCWPAGWTRAAALCPSSCCCCLLLRMQQLLHAAVEQVYYSKYYKRG